MKRGRHITETVAAMILWVALFSLPALAQRGFHPVAQQRHAPAPSPPQHMPAPRQQPPPRQQPAPRQQPPAATHPRQTGHAGDWLRRYKDMSPAEQDRALQNDPEFRRLPAGKQELLKQRLHDFSSRPPQQQLRILNRMETWEHLTPDQKRQALQFRSQMQQLPPDRQRLVRKAVEDMRSMPQDQREHIIDSDRFKGVFSDQEREMIRGAARLPLAPPEGGEGTPQQ